MTRIRGMSFIPISAFRRFIGQFDGEPAALADGAAHEDAAAVGLDDMFHDAQANANALGFAAQFGTAAVKPLENLSCSSGGMPGPWSSTQRLE